MKATRKKVTIKDLIKGYDDGYARGEEEKGIVGYDGKLDIRPPYQRNFIYEDKQRADVIKSILADLPLNVMYWAIKDDGNYEILDGQQRTISICQYVKTEEFSYKNLSFHNQPDNIKKKILDYKLMIYVCKGNEEEKLDWFKTINIAGEKLTNQEMRNAIYHGPWVTDAKRYFSRRNCPAYRIAGKYMKGIADRQEYLETAIAWDSGKRDDKTIRQYMNDHRKNSNSKNLKQYFENVIGWVKKNFPTYRKEMNGIEWGEHYNNYKNEKFDAKKIEKQIAELMIDDEVQKKSGIYNYIFDKKEKHLNLRSFDDKTKREVYDKQKGKCKICDKKFDIDDMQADHIKPWSKGGKTIKENCQMLCRPCNQEKYNN